MWLLHLPHSCKKWGCTGLAQGQRQPWDIIILKVDLDLFASGETITHSLFRHIRQSLTNTLQAQDFVQDKPCHSRVLNINNQTGCRASWLRLQLQRNQVSSMIVCHHVHDRFVKFQFSSPGISGIKNSRYINPHHHWSRGLCHSLQWLFHNDAIFTLGLKKRCSLNSFNPFLRKFFFKKFKLL